MELTTIVTFHCFFWPFPLLPQVPRIDSVQNHLMGGKEQTWSSALPVQTNRFMIYFRFIRDCQNRKRSLWHNGKAKKTHKKTHRAAAQIRCQATGNVLFTGLLFTFSKKPEASWIPHTELKQSSRNSHMTEPVVKLPKTLVAFNLTLSRL